METKDKILKTALKLFLKNGLHNVTVNKIITEVGFTQAAFYYHFKSKQELVDEVMNLFFFGYMDTTFALLEEKVSDWKGLLKLLFQLFQIELDYIAKQIEPDTFTELEMQTLIRDYLFMNSLSQEVNSRYARHKEEVIMESIKGGKAKGEIKPDIDAKSMARLIVCIQEGMKTAGECFSESFKEDLVLHNTELVIALLEA